MADCTAETAFNAGWTSGGSMSALNMPTTGYCSIATALCRFAMAYLCGFNSPTIQRVAVLLIVITYSGRKRNQLSVVYDFQNTSQKFLPKQRSSHNLCIKILQSYLLLLVMILTVTFGQSQRHKNSELSSCNISLPFLSLIPRADGYLGCKPATLIKYAGSPAAHWTVPMQCIVFRNFTARDLI